MKLFRKDSSYAVRTLVFIAQKTGSEPVSSTEVSESLGIPKNFLRRIYSKLIRGGILNATEGPRGGVSLAKSPELISVGEIVSILQGDIRVCNCFHNNELCADHDICVVRKRIIHIEKLVVSEFHKITIRSLVDDAKSLHSVEK